MDTSPVGDGFQDGKVYRAKVVDQLITKSYNDELQLVLGIKLLAALKNSKNTSDGTEECPQLEREVLITFVEDDSERLRMAVRDLERLGFDDSDITRLHPDHPNHVSLLQKEAYVRMRENNGNEYWNLAWPRERPKPLPVNELRQTASALKE